MSRQRSGSTHGLGEDLFWCLGPLERLAALIPGIDEDLDRLDKAIYLRTLQS
jgi:hypothetical protein